MSQSGRSSRAGRSNTSSPGGSCCSDDDVSSLSRYKANEKIKQDHAHRHALRQGRKENVPHYMTQTVSALQKRQSFRFTTTYPHPISSRRTQSLDIQRSGDSQLGEDHWLSSARSELGMIRSEGSVSDSLEDYVPPEEEEGEEGERHNLRLGLETMRDEVERTFRDFPDAGHPTRNNDNGNSRRYVEGGLSPLPSRASDLLSDDEIALLGEPRSRSATGLTPPKKTIPEHEQELSDEDRRTETTQVQEADASSAALHPAAEMPPLDVGVGTRDELHGRPMGMTEIEPAPPIELQAHSCPLERIASFDSTAAITFSPRESPPTPFVEELASVHKKAVAQKSNVSPRLSVVEHAIPHSADEIQDSVNTEGENSDGSRTSTEERCRTGAAISDNVPSNRYVRITEKKSRREPERASDNHEKPNIRKSLILMGIFAGVAILVGKIFTSKSP